MTSLNDDLVEKRATVAAREARIEAGRLGAVPLSAEVSVEGRSGVRRIRIRDHQVVIDSPPDFAGYDLGPGSPELQRGILGSCLAHSYLIQAARLGVPLDAVDVTVSGQLEAGTRVAHDPGYAAKVYAGYGGKGSVDELAAMLRSHTHHHHPLGAELKQQIAAYVDELKTVKVIRARTDAKQFAERVYADVLS